MSEEKEALITGVWRWLILGFIGLTVIAAIVALALPDIDDVLIVHSILDQIIVGFAYGLALPAVMGLICIFWKPLRLPTAVVLGLYLIGFVAALCIGKGIEKTSYMLHKSDRAATRYAVVTEHQYINSETAKFRMNFRFMDDGTEKTFEETEQPMPFYYCAEEGDTVRVQYIKGAGNVDFIVGVRKVMNN